MNGLTLGILITVGCFAVPAFIAGMVIRSAFNKRRDAMRQQAQTIAEKERAIAALQETAAAVEQNLLAEQRENSYRKGLLQSLAQGCKGRRGRSGLYVFASTDGQRLYEEAGCDDIADIFTEGGTVPLYEAFNAALREERLPVSKQNRYFSIEYTATDDEQTYLVTDVTDNYVAEQVTKERDALASRLDGCDIFTAAMGFEAFVKRNKSIFADSPEKNLWLLYMRTEPSVLPDEIMSNFDEAYLNMCSERLIDRFGDGKVARCSKYGLCAIMKADDEESAKSIAAELALEIENERSTLWPIDQRFKNRSVYELAYYDGGDLGDFIYGMRIRARVDMQRKNIGIHMFYSSELSQILGYKAAIEDATVNKKISFTYHPILYSGTAKVFAYEMTPRFPSLSFSSPEEMIYRARLFGFSDEMEDMLFSQALKKYDRALKGLKMLSGVRVLIKSFPGACMLRKDEDYFRAENYDLLPNLIVELSEQLPNDDVVAEIKRSKLSEWGAWCAVRADQHSDKNGMKMGVYQPQLVRISSTLLENEKYVQRIKDVIIRLHAQNVLVLVDDVTKPQHVDFAVASGADLIEGDYVSKSVNTPGEASDKCVRRIAQLRFGKRK